MSGPLLSCTQHRPSRAGGPAEQGAQLNRGPSLSTQFAVLDDLNSFLEGEEEHIGNTSQEIELRYGEACSDCVKVEEFGDSAFAAAANGPA